MRSIFYFKAGKIVTILIAKFLSKTKIITEKDVMQFIEKVTEKKVTQLPEIDDEDEDAVQLPKVLEDLKMSPSETILILEGEAELPVLEEQ